MSIVKLVPAVDSRRRADLDDQFACAKDNLDEDQPVIIIGTDRAKGGLFLSSSHDDIGELYLMLEKVKAYFLEIS